MLHTAYYAHSPMEASDGTDQVKDAVGEVRGSHACDPAKMTAQLPAFSDVIELAPDGIVILDGEGSIVYVNSRIVALFGYASSELVGRSVEALIPEHLRSRHTGHRRTYLDAPRVRSMGNPRLPLLGRRKDGGDFPVEIELAPLERGAARWTVAFVRDATERRAIMEELERSRSGAQEVARVKGEFLALAAHDLSQPAQTVELILGSLERLADLPSDVAELARIASASVARMRELLKMLLDISRLESGSIRINEQQVPVTEMFESLERQFSPAANAKSIQLRTRSSSHVLETDPTLLRGILANLVSNAIRYTPSGTVYLECENAADGGVTLAVRDTGIGIPAEQHERIFDDFYRGADAEREHRDGFGLGLGIVRRLSSLLALPVTLDSEIGRGSTFGVHVPKRKVSMLPHDLATTSAPAS